MSYITILSDDRIVIYKWQAADDFFRVSKMAAEGSFTGRVKRVDVSETAGFSYGFLLIQDAKGTRHELRYDRESNGEIPSFNDYVEVVTAGDRIISIRLIDSQIGDNEFKDFDTEQQKAARSSIGLWIIPMAYFLATAILLLLSILVEATSVILLLPVALFFISGFLVVKPKFILLTIGVYSERLNIDENSPEGYKRGLASGITGFSSGLILVMVGLGTTSGPWDYSLLFLNLGAWLGSLAIPFSFLIMLRTICLPPD